MCGQTTCPSGPVKVEYSGWACDSGLIGGSQIFSSAVQSAGPDTCTSFTDNGPTRAALSTSSIEWSCNYQDGLKSQIWSGSSSCGGNYTTRTYRAVGQCVSVTTETLTASYVILCDPMDINNHNFIPPPVVPGDYDPESPRMASITKINRFPYTRDCTGYTVQEDYTRYSSYLGKCAVYASEDTEKYECGPNWLRKTEYQQMTCLPNFVISVSEEFRRIDQCTPELSGSGSISELQCPTVISLPEGPFGSDVLPPSKTSAGTTQLPSLGLLLILIYVLLALQIK